MCIVSGLLKSSLSGPVRAGGVDSALDDADEEVGAAFGCVAP
jgi:hypothetical protein